ncbi:unnamed protein product [Peronospora belbahrii]|uniref:Uncharacterized protein n=1 Tax=Peronospora belbahrii TaxID=622444 RepID=A0ABN8CR82_9STRA|nr:unnamed protein product [Peronospora belbahrii]
MVRSLDMVGTYDGPDADEIRLLLELQLVPIASVMYEVDNYSFQNLYRAPPETSRHLDTVTRVCHFFSLSLLMKTQDSNLDRALAGRPRSNWHDN